MFTGFDPPVGARLDPLAYAVPPLLALCLIYVDLPDVDASYPIDTT